MSKCGNCNCYKCRPPMTAEQRAYEKNRPYYTNWMKELEKRDENE